ncbi:MAG: DUF4416 family protein [Deferrisomatales bacterium]
MSLPGAPEPCVLVVGVLRGPAVGEPAVLEALTSAFGPIGRGRAEEPFVQSRYYQREMGTGLLRGYLELEGLRDPGELASIKLRCNALEAGLAGVGGRAVNLDPGLLNRTQVVLASGKPAAHRVYLGQGIYAEVELVFEAGVFRPLPWTYPDYREPRAVAFFNDVREGHKRRLRSSGLHTPASVPNGQRPTDNGRA